MTPTVRRQQYTPSLSPELQQLEQLATASVLRNGAFDLSSGGADTRYDTANEHPKPDQPPLQQLHPVVLAAAKVPKHYLRTTGDLFNTPDQDIAQVPLVVAVRGTQLVSPGWNQHRPWLSGSWLMSWPQELVAEMGGAGGLESQVQDLSLLNTPEAELLLVDDLLTVFMGQAGQYIKHEMVEGPKWQRLGFKVAGVADPSLVEQVERLLPLCESGHVIKRFVETRTRIEYPMVVQLEHQLHLGKLNLAGLVYYCQAPAASLEVLASIAGDAADQPHLTSAGLLNLLAARQRALAGDRPGQLLVGQLLKASAQPYFGILRQWLFWGVLDDPYNEFMVKEYADVGRDSLTPEGEPAYWSMRYRLRGSVTTTVGSSASAASGYDVPELLASSAEAILITGKYLNVIRQCGQPVPPCPESTAAKLVYRAAAAESGSPPFLAGIQEALSAAASALLALMKGPQCRLTSWLHCLKHIFLLDQGDMLVYLLEAAEADLSQPLAALPAHQLQELLDTALRSSSVAASPHIDVLAEGTLTAVMDKRSLVQLVMAAKGGALVQEAALVLPSAGVSSSSSGWQMLLLTMKLAWPLSLVFSRRQLLHYQVLYKYLLSLKYAERQLNQVWQSLRATKRLSREDQLLFRPWSLLCNQLQYVVGEVMRFATIDVLEPLWGDMEAHLARAANMDDVIVLHNSFLSAALERCLLTQIDVVKLINSLLAAAAELAQQAAALVDIRSTGVEGVGSSRSSSSHGGRKDQRAAAAIDHLRVMSMFCRDVTRQAQLETLQAQVQEDMQKLALQLNMHYESLLKPQTGAAASASGACSEMKGWRAAKGVGSGIWGSRSSRAGIGDSSRDLASLHNLIQRLDWGCKIGRQDQQLWPAAY
eukprot:gene11046-11201_t